MFTTFRITYIYIFSSIVKRRWGWGKYFILCSCDPGLQGATAQLHGDQDISIPFPEGSLFSGVTCSRWDFSFFKEICQDFQSGWIISKFQLKSAIKSRTLGQLPWKAKAGLEYVLVLRGGARNNGAQCWSADIEWS